MEPTRTSPKIAGLGKGLVQINLRLTRITELLERGAPASNPSAPHLELLLDLLDAVDRALAAGRAPVVAPPAWQRWLGVVAQPGVDLTGLSLARDHALAQLEGAGLAQAPIAGRVDPHLHRVIEVKDCADPALDGTIAATHRQGWFRPGDPPTPVRHAHVTAWRAHPSEKSP